MLDSTCVAPATCRHPAVIHAHGLYIDGPGCCTVHHQHGSHDAWTWLPLAAITRGYVTTLEITRHGQADFLLLAVDADNDIPLASLLHDSLCPIPDVVRQTVGLIQQIACPALEQFVVNALLHPDALHGFWTSPASRHYHHAYPGGLAKHSLEVATMVSSSAGLLPEDRDLGIALAILHDYGKVWCYDRQLPNPANSKLHINHGREMLSARLAQLQSVEPWFGLRMDELLGGPKVARLSPYPLAIGRVVHAFDQMSCEMSRQARDQDIESFYIPF